MNSLKMKQIILQPATVLLLGFIGVVENPAE
jgi:hypothetical protein